MRTHLLLGALGICAVGGTYQSTIGSAGSGHQAETIAAETSPAVTPRRNFGHLILQIEGNANALRVTRITPKKSGYNPTSRTSPYQIELLDAGGQVLGSYPLDLSLFDMNPARVGKPLRVQGCEVRDTRVATLANVPYLAHAVTVRILRGNRVFGFLNTASYRKLVAQGEVR